MNIFISENDKKDETFDKLVDKLDVNKLKNEIKAVFKKASNNYIGYYLFQDSDKYYKIFVLPKNIPLPKSNNESEEREAIKQFLSYLKIYYKLKSTYHPDYKIKDLGIASLTEFAFDSSSAKKSTNDIEEFIFYKYKFIIQEILNFFNSHKSHKRVNHNYISQTIKHKINLLSNIKEIDKTKIHQERYEDVIYSQIATVAYGAIKLFIRQKIDLVAKVNHNELLQLSLKLQNLLLKKYNLDKSYHLSLPKLTGTKTYKYFKKKQTNKVLYSNILSLFGLEHFFDDNGDKDINRNIKSDSLFLRPETMYEWYVYDILKKYAKESDKTILFDKLGSKTTTEYELKTQKKSISKSSKPDYVLIDDLNSIKIIIDAKWKNTDINSSKTIEPSDYLKLKLDSSLLDDDKYKTISCLIYSKIITGNDQINMNVDQEFNFTILQVDMNFDEEQNKINFKNEYAEIQQRMETEIEIKKEKEKLNKIKIESNLLSDDINNCRTEVITKLFNQENFESKEEILNELDTKLLQSAEKVNNSIDEFISPEIQRLLVTYEDVLEEDSKKFLKSSSSIYNYYKDKNYNHFDYSMPGSGLWKLIELELNTSFSWFLRVQSSVCNNACPWTNISNRKRSITQDLDNGKKVKLNQYEHNDKTKLQGLMLGGISLLLQDNSTIEEFNEITNLDRDFFTSKLILFVSSIIKLRNEHAHIKAMSLEKYQELHGLLFNNSSGKLYIEYLLNFKKEIREYIS